MLVPLTADSNDRVSCIPETFAALEITCRGDYFDTKFNVVRATVASKMSFESRKWTREEPNIYGVHLYVVLTKILDFCCTKGNISPMPYKSISSDQVAKAF